MALLTARVCSACLLILCLRRSSWHLKCCCLCLFPSPNNCSGALDLLADSNTAVLFIASAAPCSVIKGFMLQTGDPLGTLPTLCPCCAHAAATAALHSCLAHPAGASGCSARAAESVLAANGCEPCPAACAEKSAHKTCCCSMAAGNGTGGESIWGGEFPDEISRWGLL